MKKQREKNVVIGQKKQKYDELLRKYREHMRIALRNQQEAYFCLLELLDNIFTR
jgi:hypothetical protein